MPGVGDLAARLVSSVESVIIGKRWQIEQLLVAVLSEGHILIEDVPGTGKTMLARALAASLHLSFRRVQCTPDLLPSDITGVRVFDQRRADFEFRPGPVFTNVLLTDEINRATPRTQSALLEAMAEGQVTVDGETHQLAPPFLVLATQNPIELEGTFPLPEAQLDRFMISMAMGYPSPADEVAMAGRIGRRHPIEDVKAVVSSAELAEATAEVAGIHLDEDLLAYAVGLVDATRRHPHVALGASPRATLALIRTARALAALRGRDFVIPDDIKVMAAPVMTHRLSLTAEARLRDLSAAGVVSEILEAAPLAGVG
jgi:MoxR-like ATPase